MIIVGSPPPFPAHATQTPCSVARPILCCSFGCVGAIAHALMARDPKVSPSSSRRMSSSQRERVEAVQREHVLISVASSTDDHASSGHVKGVLRLLERGAAAHSSPS